MTSFVIFYSLAYIAYQIYLQVFLWNKVITWVLDVFIGFLVVMLLMYSVIIIMLNRTMRSLTGDFKKEIRSVNNQFFVFLISYLTICAYSTCLASTKFTTVVGQEALDLAYIILAFFW